MKDLCEAAKAKAVLDHTHIYEIAYVQRSTLYSSFTCYKNLEKWYNHLLISVLSVSLYVPGPKQHKHILVIRLHVGAESWCIETKKIGMLR